MLREPVKMAKVEIKVLALLSQPEIPPGGASVFLGRGVEFPPEYHRHVRGR